MTARIGRPARRALAVAFALVLGIILVGCGKPASTTKTTGTTAKSLLPVARSALSTTAPDAKLLVVQTAQPVTTTATPVWGFLFGSPKSDTVYVVYVDKGKAAPPQEYGTAGLGADEWAAVPSTDDWKIDSDEAYKKALAASGAKGTPLGYAMGFVTYIPKSAESSRSVAAMKWNVTFEPGTSGATTKTIEVDVKTGSATVPK